MGLAAGVGIILTACAPKSYHTDSLQVPAAGAGQSASGWVGGEARFVWPLQGNMVVPFGAKEDNVSTKGIVIAAREGEPVIAAETGRVTFLSEKMKGYGRTIILEHAAEYSTVYARLAKILVKSGDWVRQGQEIAVVGSAGRGGSPQLYFEIRRRARAENPIPHLSR